jgi:hypothetical protein
MLQRIQNGLRINSERDDSNDERAHDDARQNATEVAAIPARHVLVAAT